MPRPPRSPLPHAALLGGALALACGAGARQAAAQAASQAAPPDVAEAGDAAIALPPISVTATRGPRPVDEVPATVTIIESEQLERQNANRPQDIIRYEPGISFGNQPGRTGGTNFVIRGIGENRVRVQVDGIRVPDFPGSNAGAGTFTRDFVDLESVKRIEILRGPASALYGSDALGGVVAYTLKDPRDYLAETNANTFLSGRFGYNGADRSVTSTLTGAARAGNVEALLLYTRRDGHELTPNGSLKPNPQDYYVNNILGRLIWRGQSEDALRLTGEFFERITDTNVLTDRGVTPGAGGGPSTAVLDSRGDDRSFRGRLSLDYVRELPLGFLDRLETRAWWTRLQRTEETVQQRSSFFGTVPPALPNRLRWSDFRFEEEIVGGEVQASSRLALLGLEHRLTYGATLEHISVSRPRDRTETNLTTGAVTATVAGETFPNKNFPDTDILQGGVYLQDEMAIGRVSVVPAVRLDYYQLRPNPDADFARSAASTVAEQVRNLDRLAVSPKLGAVWRLDQVLSVFGQYAHGFRAPPYDNANFGFTNRVFGYQILPATNLKPETSDGVEAGLRGRWADGSFFQVSGFWNQYSNFIDTAVVGRAGGLIQYQYRNLSSVTIWGFEAGGLWQFAPRWALRGSAAFAQGENNDTGRPIDSVDPARFVTGLAWQHPNGLGAEAIATYALRHSRVSDGSFYKAPGYAVLDLAAHYDLRPHLTINAGLFNVFDQKYFNTQDVIGLAVNNPNRDLYAQPGRYAAVNLILRW